ncbi:MAG TPA: alpha/beta hydrolase [Gaiellaceae bacterium]|jgi:acetyl esterase/lipase
MRRRLVVALAVAVVAASSAGVVDAGESSEPIRSELNVRYGGSDAAPLLLDAFVPRDRHGVPAVILVHGGGWTAGDRASLAPTARRLAALGFAAFSIDYRLAPTWRFPAPVDDVGRAVAWVRSHAARFDLDPARVGLIGSSAGANLVLLTALRRPDLVRAVVSWSAPTDLLAFFHESSDEHVLAAIRTYVGCAPKTCPARYRAASPVGLVGRGDPAVLVANSSREIVPLAQARALAARLTRAGVPHRVIVFPGTRHADEYARAIWTPMVEFLRRHLGPAG